MIVDRKAVENYKGEDVALFQVETVGFKRFFTLIAELECNENVDEVGYTPIRVNEYTWGFQPDSMSTVSDMIMHERESRAGGIVIYNTHTPLEALERYTDGKKIVYMQEPAYVTTEMFDNLCDGFYLIMGYESPSREQLLVDFIREYDNDAYRNSFDGDITTEAELVRSVERQCYDMSFCKTCVDFLNDIKDFGLTPKQAKVKRALVSMLSM